MLYGSSSLSVKAKMALNRVWKPSPKKVNSRVPSKPEQFPTHTPDVTIVGGLGRVGLPLGITLAQAGRRVCLLHRDADKAAAVNNLEIPFVEHGAEALLEQTMDNGNLWASLDVAAVASSRYVVVTIGTSLDQRLKPDAQEFIEAIYALVPFLNDEHIIIRSTIVGRSVFNSNAFGQKCD